MDELDILDLVVLERRDYAKNWSVDATRFDSEGAYAWMESQIAGRRRVLEVGVGVGHSTVTLARAGHAVVGLEENPECLTNAAGRLRDAGVDASVDIQRARLRKFGNRYFVEYEDLAAPSKPVHLAQADLLHDPNLVDWLVGLKPFDAVLCWLMGTHGGHYEHAAYSDRPDLDPSSHRAPQIYRLSVQNALYAISGRLLAQDGVLHFVDRMEAPDNAELLDSIVQAHSEMADGSGLAVTPEDVQWRPYEVHGQGVGYRATVGTSGRTWSRPPALVSVLARRQGV